MTDAEIRDAAVAHLKKTTVGYVNKHWKVPPQGSEWDQAFDLLAQIGVVTPPPTITPLYSADFETGDFSQITSRQNPNRIQLVQPGLEGQYAIKFTCGPSDANVTYPGSPPRAEIEVKALSASAGYPFYPVAPSGASMHGKETWMTWKMRFFTGWDHAAAWCVVNQIESQTGSAWPTFSLNCVGPSPSKMYLVVRGGSFQSYPNDPAQSAIVFDALPMDKTIDCKVHHKWSWNADGLVEFFADGQRRGSISGPNVWQDGQPGVSGQGSKPWSQYLYQKCGIYRSGSGLAHDSSIEYDSIDWYDKDPG